MTDYYLEDLAWIHDTGYGAVARDAAARLLIELRRLGLDRGVVVDLGCGSGILAEIVTDAGYDVYGVDISAAMIGLARRRAPRATFVQDRLLAAEIPACIAVTATGEAINYLFDADVSQTALSGWTQCIRRSLHTPGVVLMDFALPSRRRASARQRFSHNADWTTLVEVKPEADPRILTREIVSYRRVGDLFRRSEETHRQRLLARSEVAEPLRAAGLSVRFLSGYADRKFPPGIAGLSATAR